MLISILPVSSAFAQYTVYQWSSFEDNRLPADAVAFGARLQTDMKIVDLSSLTGMPAEFRASAAAQETGRYGMLLRADPKSSATRDFLMGMTAGLVLDRDELGTSRKALYQADFFVPAAGRPVPELAVLAAESVAVTAGTAQVPKQFYRFGIRNNGLYYSRILLSHPTDYRQDSSLLSSLPRPGWHRMAIVFEGADTLRFYIDGREPSFSPLKDAALRRLKVGVMLAEDRRIYDSFVDNLSIQVGENVPLPASPYSAGWKVPLKGQVIASVQPPASVKWLEPAEAWTTAQRAKIPMLLYFHAPTVPASASLNEILGSKPEAKKFLGQYACAQIDVNQLMGGSIAGQYKVFRVPTFLIIAPEVKEVGRITFTKEDTWETFEAQLRSLPYP